MNESLRFVEKADDTAHRISNKKLLFDAREITFNVGKQKMLGPLEIEVRGASVLGLIGHNGSGKSTLLKLLAGQQKPSAGEILFQDKRFEQWGTRDFARKVAYLPQQTPAAPGIIVRELVAFGRYPWHGPLGVYGEQDRRLVRQAMALTGTDLLADRLVDTLSGGERQRVWIAMLIAQDTECLLLDEPTAALDVAHQIESLALIQQLAKSKGLGIVVVLHDVNMAMRYCDQIVALRHGQVCAQGAPEKIAVADTLSEIYGVRMEVVSDCGVPVSFPS
jgi:iron complex transport system ATP-binding protein